MALGDSNSKFRTSQVVVASTATLISAYDGLRGILRIRNRAGDGTAVFVGNSSAVTTSTGDILSDGNDWITVADSDVYAIVASGTLTVYVLEEYS